MLATLVELSAAAAATGVMGKCRSTNVTDLPPAPALPAGALSGMHEEVQSLRRHSDTVVWTHCGGNYTICLSTVPRWHQYTRAFNYDMLVIRKRSAAITGIATHAWDRIFVAWQLMRLGYEWALHVDGDTGVLDWKQSIHDFVRSARRADSPFLYLSQDVGKHGFLPAPCGPNNFGIFLIRNSDGARAMLRHVLAQSQRPGKFWQAWPAEQGVVNMWLSSQAAADFHQAPYGRMQRHLSKYDHPIHLRVPSKSAGGKSAGGKLAGSGSRSAGKSAGANALIEETLTTYQKAGVWILHTPAMQPHKEFVRQVYEAVERLWPIDNHAIHPYSRRTPIV